MAIKTATAKQPGTKQYKEAILRGDRVLLGQAITLIESNRARIRYLPVTGGGSCFRVYFLEAVPAALA